jgi:hypothetical protein
MVLIFNDKYLFEDIEMDIVQLDVPLFIRLLELAREDIKQDADLHDLAQAVIAASQDGPVTMASYDKLVNFMRQQGEKPEEQYGNDDIRRFRQIIDLADNGETTQYSNTPKEEYADVASVTTAAGGGVHAPKHPDDLRGNSLSIYRR